MSIPQQQLESQLWKTIDKLRGPSGAYHSMQYLIGLLFLKYLSDRSATSGDSMGERKAFQLTIPQATQWHQLSFDPSGKALTAAIQAFESHPDNEQLGRVFTRLGLPELAIDPNLYQSLASSLSNIDLSEVRGEDLAQTVSHLLERSAEAAGRLGGEHHTHSDLSLLAAELLAPTTGSTMALQDFAG